MADLPLGGGGWMLFKRTQIAVKPKAFSIPMWNESIIISNIAILKPGILYYLDQRPSKSEINKRNNTSLTFHARKVQERLFVEPFKTTLIRDTTAKKVLSSFALILLSLLCLWNTTHLVDFQEKHLNDILLLQKKQNTWNHILTRQSSEKVPYKPGLDYVSERYLQRTCAQVISVLPENFLKNFETGGTACPTPIPSR